MSNDRREFEAWAVTREFDVSPNTTVFKEELPYADIETQSHFDAYEAGRKAGWQAHAESVADDYNFQSPNFKAESLSGAAPTKLDLEELHRIIKCCMADTMVGYTVPLVTDYKKFQDRVEGFERMLLHELRKFVSQVPSLEKAQGVESAAKLLVTKLDLIADDPQYKSVFTMLHVRGGKYTGPNYGQELAALKSALAPNEEQERKR